LVVTDRDIRIIRETARWRVLLGRQVKIIGGFTGTRATDRRLKKLVDNGFLEKKKYIYGIASIYNVTPLAKRKFDLGTYINKVRLEQIEHDMAVVDTYLYLKEKYSIKSDDVKSEKELRNEKGFITRGHVPDFTFNCQDEKYAVEIELTLKSKERFQSNVKNNYLEFDKQIWVVSKWRKAIIEQLKEFQHMYGNIEILFLEDFIKGVKC